MKTLVVEDSAAFRQAFTEALRRTFPHMFIQEAVDGVEAIERVEAFMPDLVFMDIRLPGETGFELTRRIKARHPEMLVVILTDYNLPEYRTAAFNSGADDFVVKGTLDPAALEALVRSFLLLGRFAINDADSEEVDALCPECGNAFKIFIDRIITDGKDPEPKIKDPCPVCGCGECKIGK
ncbi:MAG: response regulator transcription factor [Deltaproteobacteria bacterium]|nr:response regulator transcription factor [Deltaproteobacteria bacterium]MBW2601186.1 response regulator transcription factor [Deltaproteobacteria bacterium]